jgi:hypothetical protein
MLLFASFALQCSILAIFLFGSYKNISTTESGTVTSPLIIIVQHFCQVESYKHVYGSTGCGCGGIVLLHKLMRNNQIDFEHFAQSC